MVRADLEYKSRSTLWTLYQLFGQSQYRNYKQLTKIRFYRTRLASLCFDYEQLRCSPLSKLLV